MGKLSFCQRPDLLSRPPSFLSNAVKSAGAWSWPTHLLVLWTTCGPVQCSGHSNKSLKMFQCKTGLNLESLECLAAPVTKWLPFRRIISVRVQGQILHEGTSVTYYQSTPRHVSQDLNFEPRRFSSLKLCIKRHTGAQQQQNWRGSWWNWREQRLLEVTKFRFWNVIVCTERWTGSSSAALCDAGT